MSAKKPQRPDKFTQVPNQVWDLPVSDKAIRVYGIILTYDWMDDGARPGIETIAIRGRMSRSKVERAITELVEAGLIKVDPRFGGPNGKQPLPNRYHFLPLPAAASDGFMGEGRVPPRVKGGPLTGQGRVPPQVTREADKDKNTNENHTGLDGTNAFGGSTRAAFGEIQEEPGDHLASAGNLGTTAWAVNHQPPPVSTPKDLGFNSALADSTKERQAGEIVDLLNQLRVERLEKSAMTDKQREHNLKTARLLLDNDGKSDTEITGMLRWAYDDVHWSTRITSLYRLRENYVELLHESQHRRPNRFPPRTEPHGSKFTPGPDQKKTARRGPAGARRLDF